jgi:hypothetical protein
VHAHDLPATITQLGATLDRATGAVLKARPRVLARGASAEVTIALRAASLSGPATRARGVPLEPFAANKDMGRVLVRRGGETVAAGTFCVLSLACAGCSRSHRNRTSFDILGGEATRELSRRSRSRRCRYCILRKQA